MDFIDESEVLTPADEAHHIDKHAFTTPFVCGARNLGEALRRIAEGAAMIRTKGEAGTGDVVHAVQHMRQIVKEMKALTVLSEQELYAAAKEHQAPYELIRMVAQAGKLPVPNFSAGGIATPADAALMMQLGAEAIFVGSGIFMKERATPLDVENNPKEREEAVSRAKAIVIATTHLQRSQDPGRSQRAGDRHHEGSGRGSHRRIAVAADSRLVVRLSVCRMLRAGSCQPFVNRLRISKNPNALAATKENDGLNADPAAAAHRCTGNPGRLRRACGGARRSRRDPRRSAQA